MEPTNNVQPNDDNAISSNQVVESSINDEVQGSAESESKIEQQPVLKELPIHEPDKLLNSSTKKANLFKYKNIKFVILGIIILVLATLPSIYFYNKYQSTQKDLNNNKSRNSETANLLNYLGKLVLLPSNEEPVIGTLSDISKFKDQIFYKDAKNGDKLIVYNKAGKAILYRPSLKKIVSMYPLTVDNEIKTTNP